MKKLYRYRPLSSLLYKELFYQELYFSSYDELNDPLDLKARIDFSSKTEEQIEYLIWFIFKTHLDLSNENDAEGRKVARFGKNIKARDELKNEILKNTLLFLKSKKYIWVGDIIRIIIDSIDNNIIEFYPDVFVAELNRLVDKFFKNSYVTCFSETNDNFLMWSHYASSHKGVCLEFDIVDEAIAYERKGKRKIDKKKYSETLSEWKTKSVTYWSKGIRKVRYENRQPFINFYDFIAAFENEYDCDLVGLSKPWTHKYAKELEEVFSKKTNSWKYEREWRAIEINFGNFKEPEERIRHYPIESLSAINFGFKTPIEAKNRIYKMMTAKNPEIKFYQSHLDGNEIIKFSMWEYMEK